MPRVNAADRTRAIAGAWTTRASASARRPAPSARATAEAIPPPMPPLDIVTISIQSGKTRETPASASAPSRPTTKGRGEEDPAGGPRPGARRSPCPVACALDVVGDRWTLLLIRDLLGGKKRYGDFLASSEKIPTNILADRLRRLEREGLIRRVPYSVHPPRAEYQLTASGRELGQAVDALAEWG